MPKSQSLSVRARLLRLVVRYGIASCFKATTSIDKQRRIMNKMSLIPVPRGTRIEPVSAAGVAAEWVVPPGAGDAVILYLHGGGYNIGSPGTHRAMVARLADAAEARALVLDYRLAPEYPHPAALEDSLAGYNWLLGQGVQPGKITLAGDSAGGGLALATLVSLRDAGIALPAAAVCLSPWTDVSLSGATMRTLEDKDPMLNRPWLEQMAAGYTRGGVSRQTPLVSPLFADLKGLPRLLIQVGSDEMLLSDAERLGARAREAGVPVTLEVWEGLWHVWQVFAGYMPEADRAIAGIAAFIQAHPRA
jgi:acetyl esterase/lipase